MELVAQVARTAGTLVEGMSALVVTYGACEALVRLVRLATVPSAPHGARKEIWRQFGTWLLFGLEFALAADIIATLISPTWDDIGRLGAIVVLRTFLNYFLEKDLKSGGRIVATMSDHIRTAPRLQSIGRDWPTSGR